MTRKILGGLVAALLLSPAVSFASPKRAGDVTPDGTQTSTVGQIGKSKTRMKSQQQVQQHGATGDSASSGTGMTYGNEPGHVASPSNTQVDTSTRGPLNDVQPGAPQSSDTSAAQHPAPSPVRR